MLEDEPPPLLPPSFSEPPRAGTASRTLSTTLLAALLIAAAARRAAGRTAAAAAPTAAPTAPAATVRPVDDLPLLRFELAELRPLDPPLLLRAPPEPERLPELLLLLPLLLREPELEPLLRPPPEEALPPLRPAAARFADVDDDFEDDDFELPPERPLLLPPLLPPLLLPPPEEALPPLRPAAARFAEVDDFELLPEDERPLLLPPLLPPLLLPPPDEALPPLRPAAARFAEVELLDEDFEEDFDEEDDDLEDLDDFEEADDFLAPPLLLDAPPFFAPFDALFLDAAMVVSPIQKGFGGEPYFSRSENLAQCNPVYELHKKQCRRTCADCHVEH
ncbi:MAG TPA: hypothetical protein VF846_03725 [Thermoanaerobaculia bacterium]